MFAAVEPRSPVCKEPTMTFRRIAAVTFSGLLLAGLAATTADAATQRRHSTARHHAASTQHHRATTAQRAPRVANSGERAQTDRLNDQALQNARVAQ